MAWLFSIFLFGVYLSNKDSAAIIASAIFGVGGSIGVAISRLIDRCEIERQDSNKNDQNS